MMQVRSRAVMLMFLDVNGLVLYSRKLYQFDMEYDRVGLSGTPGL
jgi:hypothetical protein